MDPECRPESPANGFATTPISQWDTTAGDAHLKDVLFAACDNRRHQYLALAAKIRESDEETAGKKAELLTAKEHLGSGVNALDAASADSTSLGSVDDIKKSVTAYEDILLDIEKLKTIRAECVVKVREFQEFDQNIGKMTRALPEYSGPSLEGKEDKSSKSGGKVPLKLRLYPSSHERAGRPLPVIVDLSPKFPYEPTKCANCGFRQ